MDKEVSIVLSVERKNHRKLAQEWYGLTDEQMIDMDVHHNPPRHQGGRNIPEHLFVYHETLHSAVHGDDFTKWSRKGSEKAVEVNRKNGTAFFDPKVPPMGGFAAHREKDEDGKSILAKRVGSIAGPKTFREKLGIFSPISEEEKFARCSKGGKAGSQITHSKKDEKGRSIVAMRAAESTHSTKWEDPDHPELGHKPPGILVVMQKRRGYPHGPENRRRVQ